MADANNGKIMTQAEKTQLILNKGCEYLGITRDQLLEGLGSKSKIWDKKRFLIPILYDYTICNYSDIAFYLGYKTHSNVIYHLNLIKDELSVDVYGSEKTKQVYKELLSYLNL